MPVVVQTPVAEQQSDAVVRAPQPPHPEGAGLRSEPLSWGPEHWNQFCLANTLEGTR